MTEKGVSLIQKRTLALGVVLVLLVLVTMTAVVLAQAPESIGSSSTTAADVVVTKLADADRFEPDSRVAYTVVFSNSSASDVVLDVITDVLPAPFVYGGLGLHSDVLQEPGDVEEPEIVWTGAFTVPAQDTLTLYYYVQVPATAEPSNIPYTNTVTAVYEDITVGPAAAGITVVSADVTMKKSASPPKVDYRDLVTYTVTFDNTGNAAALIDAITDTLPVGFEFQGISPGSTLSGTPSGVAGTIAWSGPFTLEAEAALTLTYMAKASIVGGTTAVNQAQALIDGEIAGPVSATITVGTPRVVLPVVVRNWSQPRFQVSKSASMDEVLQSETVVYTVRLTNVGSAAGTLDEIRDVLPSGFLFLGMTPGSQVPTAPAGTTNTIVWKGPFEVGAGQSLTLIYQVRVSDVAGIYTNWATATTLQAIPPTEPATATITVKEPYLLWEDFEDGREDWVPFLNYWRLHPEQWFLQNGAGTDGSVGMNHQLGLGVIDPRGDERGADDAILMYEGEGSSEWVNYRVEADVILREGDDDRQMGLWFRGKYTEPEDTRADTGKFVEGYYLVFRPRPQGSRSIVLSRVQPSGPTAYHFSDPEVVETADREMHSNRWYRLAVEVVGSTITVFVDGDEVMSVQDSAWKKGTVGFFCYNIQDATWDNVLVMPID